MEEAQQGREVVYSYRIQYINHACGSINLDLFPVAVFDSGVILQNEMLKDELDGEGRFSSCTTSEDHHFVLHYVMLLVWWLCCVVTLMLTGFIHGSPVPEEEREKMVQ